MPMPRAKRVSESACAALRSVTGKRRRALPVAALEATRAGNAGDGGEVRRDRTLGHLGAQLIDHRARLRLLAELQVRRTS
jgi:hypothetical protein